MMMILLSLALMMNSAKTDKRRRIQRITCDVKRKIFHCFAVNPSALWLEMDLAHLLPIAE